jgi:hypothetical protein
MKKDNREGYDVDENQLAIQQAFQQGFIEIVTDEDLNAVKEEITRKMAEREQKIFTDTFNKSRTVTEVVTPKNTEKNKGLTSDMFFPKKQEVKEMSAPINDVEKIEKEIEKDKYANFYTTPTN